MSEFPLGYERIAPATWVYLSSLLMIGLYFKFNRIWSVRNLDLILLILLSPGLLLVGLGSSWSNLPSSQQAAVGAKEVPAAPEVVEPARLSDASAVAARPSGGRALQLAGYIWLFIAGVLFVVRMLLDPMMTRRPLLDPNLSTGGFIFIGCSLFVFLMANVVTSRPTRDDLEGPRSAEQLVSGRAVDRNDDSLTRHGPGYAVIHVLPSLPTVAMSRDREVPRGIGGVRTWTYGDSRHRLEAEYLGRATGDRVRLRDRRGMVRTVARAELSAADRAYLRKLGAYTIIAKMMAILGHLAVIIGMVLVGYCHFGNLKMGVGAATLYLMLPYTALMTGRVDHVIPAALLVWAVFFYRQPLVAGMFIGLAAGVLYYPLFLLPLWLSFYWQRGLLRFSVGVLSMLLFLALSLVFVSTDLAAFGVNLQKMFGIWLPIRSGLQGIWGLGWDPVFRLPLLVAFMVMSVTFGIWPAQKNLGTLLSCSAALMVATQFWHGFGGGLYMAWYLPLALLTIFRPNLEDRVALTVLGEGWLARRRHLSKAGLAA